MQPQSHPLLATPTTMAGPTPGNCHAQAGPVTIPTRRLIGKTAAELSAWGKTKCHHRSARWPAVRRRHLRDHPACVVCGMCDRPTVHHILPVSQRPDLELVPWNLETLCEEHHPAMRNKMCAKQPPALK